MRSSWYVTFRALYCLQLSRPSVQLLKSFVGTGILFLGKA